MNNEPRINSGERIIYRMRYNRLIVLLLWIIILAVIAQSFFLFQDLEEKEKIKNYNQYHGLYHIKIGLSPYEKNSVFLPFPIWQNNNEIIGEVFNNLTIIEGNCTYRIVMTEYGSALEINSTSAFDIISNYTIDVSKLNDKGSFGVGLSLKAQNSTNRYNWMYENYYMKMTIFNEVKIVSIYFESHIPVSLTHLKLNGYKSYINASSSNNSWVTTGFNYEELSLSSTKFISIFPDFWICATAILILLTVLFTLIFFRNRKRLKRKFDEINHTSVN